MILSWNSVYRYFFNLYLIIAFSPFWDVACECNNSSELLLPHSRRLHPCMTAWHLTHKMANRNSSSEALTMAPLTFGLGLQLDKILTWCCFVIRESYARSGEAPPSLCVECRHLKVLFYGPIKCSKLPVMCSHCLMRTPAPTLHTHTIIIDLWQFHDTSCLFYFIYIVKSNTLYQYTTECHI